MPPGEGAHCLRRVELPWLLAKPGEAFGVADGRTRVRALGGRWVGTVKCRSGVGEDRFLHEPVAPGAINLAEETAEETGSYCERSCRCV